MIRQSDGTLRAKGSEENWAGCARCAREPASRNVRASTVARKKFLYLMLRACEAFAVKKLSLDGAIVS
jgi:hypothetical protein